MTIREYIITADEDKWLTQKEDVGNNNRLYTKELRLGKFDSSDNWRDADDAEKIEFEKRMEEEARKEHPNEP